jgi:erythromycin esterase
MPDPIRIGACLLPCLLACVLAGLLAGLLAGSPPPAGAAVEPIRSAEPVTVAGQVTDPAGRPVAGARVALIPRGSRRAAAVVTTGADGSFRATVAKARYGMTASAPGLAAVYAPPLAIGEQAPPVKLALGAGCVDLIGTVEAAGGPPPAGTPLAVDRFSARDTGLFYGELDGAGSFHLCLSPGKYEVVLEAADFIAKPVHAELAKGGSDQRLTLHASRLAPAPAEVVSWLRGHQVPLRTAVAGQGYDDLRPLAAIVGKARIVALGEATHGSREFFQLKHRVLEYLVAEQGFTVFAIEANWPESLAVDDYVLHGVGDPAEALAGLYFWTWNTEEVLDMIRWMRAYNADPAHARKVRFLGFDMQTARVAGPAVAAYLETVDPAYATVTSTTAPAPATPRWANPCAAASAPTTSTSASSSTRGPSRRSAAAPRGRRGSPSSRSARAPRATSPPPSAAPARRSRCSTCAAARPADRWPRG